jgi:hypothetical protein
MNGLAWYCHDLRQDCELVCSHEDVDIAEVCGEVVGGIKMILILNQDSAVHAAS